MKANSKWLPLTEMQTHWNLIHFLTRRLLSSSRNVVTSYVNLSPVSMLQQTDIEAFPAIFRLQQDSANSFTNKITRFRRFNTFKSSITKLLTACSRNLGVSFESGRYSTEHIHNLFVLVVAGQPTHLTPLVYPFLLPLPCVLHVYKGTGNYK